MSERTAADPSVTVILPVYNVAPYLDACLESIVGQTFDDLEIVAVDDGSTDGSAEILARWARTEQRLRVLTRANAGLSAARNAGLEAARGGWICFVNSDDLVRADYVEGLLAAARRANAPLAVSAIDYLLPDGTLQYHSTFHAPERVAPHLADGRLDLRDKRVLGELFPSAWNKIYRRELFARLRFPTGLYYEDHPVFFALTARLDRCGYTCEPLYRQRRERAGSLTGDRGDRVFDIFPILRLVQEIISEALPPPLSLRLFRQVALRLLWERSNSIPSPETFSRFAAEAQRLLAETGVDRIRPLAEDRWIPSAFARRLRLSPAAPFCTVVATFADDAAYLPVLLDSLAEQTLRDVEVLLVDNGAPQAAAALAEVQCAKDRRFRALRLEPGSLGAARNAGLEAARGEYVWFIEGNDLARPDGLERLFSYAVDADADIVVSGFDYVRPDGAAYHSGFHRRAPEIEALGRPAKLELGWDAPALVADALATPANKLFRRGFLDQHGLRFETAAAFEEQAFWCDSAAAHPRVFYSSEALALVRDEPDARRIWSGETAAFDTFPTLDGLRGRLAPPLFARLAVRLAWERLSFAVHAPGPRAVFARRWREATADFDLEALQAARDEYIGRDFLESVFALARPVQEASGNGSSSETPSTAGPAAAGLSASASS